MSLAGWLFADLMLALAALFFAANTRGEALPLPRITGFEPISGAPGTRVTIHGEFLSDSELVTFADLEAQILMAADREVVAVVPAAAETGPISVRTQRGLATGPTSFTVTIPSTPTPTPIVIPTPSPTLAPSPTPCVSTVLLDKHEVSVGPGPGGARPTEGQLRDALARFEGRRVGLLLTFGRGPNPASGKSLALAVNERLRALLPEMFGAGALLEGYHYLGPPYNQVDLDLFFLSDECPGRVA